MLLAPGTRLGPYEVLSAIGAGGMGEVFRARDTKLGRDVAIKALPAEFAKDHERVARFKREAQILAALNHPNIAGIYGLEQTDETLALAMEYVEGEDLAQRLRRGAVPVDDAIGIARQMAEGLEEAHERGIIHRDLKPANVKVTPEGKVKILDFGLAKAIEGDAGAAGASGELSRSPTMTQQGTMAGMILGTAAYMSPEQARGRKVDRRADIWSFGVVLYEMLAGRRAFAGDDVSITLANVMKDEARWEALPADLPRSVRLLLQRCLDKDPKKRLRDIGEARLALETVGHDKEGSGGESPAGRTRVLRLLAAAVAAGALTGAIAWRARAPRPEPEQRVVILAPTDAPPQDAKISPDGSAIAIVASGKVWLRKLTDFTATEVPGSEGASSVFWSPDSTQVGFQARAQLWRTGVGGGTPSAIGVVPEDFTPSGSAAWSAGRIVFSTGTSTLMGIAPGGGAPAQPLMALDPRKDVDIHSPALLPDGRGVLFVRHPADNSARPVQFWNGSEATTLVAGEGAVGSSGVAMLGSPVYSPTGHVLFEMNGGVWAVPFSIRSTRATGDPFLVADAARSPSVAHDGVIVMLSGRPTTSLRLTWVDRSGKPGAHVSEKRGAAPQISPDGRLAAVTVGFGADADIWLIDLVRGVERRLTFESSADAQPSWSPDGKTLVYRCGLSICARAADGTGEPVELVQNARNAAVSPDGRYLVFVREDGPTAGICAQELGPAGLSSKPKGEPRVVIAPRAPGSFEISPDGRYLAYSSKDNGSDGVFVTTFPVSEGRWEIPVRAAIEPRWDPRGERLYVVDDLTRIVEVPVDLKGVFTAGRPEAPMPRLGTQRRVGYDVSKSGSFLVPVTPVDESQAHILMIRNWKPR